MGNALILEVRDGLGELVVGSEPFVILRLCAVVCAFCLVKLLELCLAPVHGLPALVELSLAAFVGRLAGGNCVLRDVILCKLLVIAHDILVKLYLLLIAVGDGLVISGLVLVIRLLFAVVCRLAVCELLVVFRQTVDNGLEIVILVLNLHELKLVVGYIEDTDRESGHE